MRYGLLRWRLCLNQIISSWYASVSLLMVFARCFKQRTIPFFTVYEWWELKLRYCPVKVDLRYTDDLNPSSVRVSDTSRKGNLLSCSFSIVNCIDGRIEFMWSIMSEHLPDEAREWMCHYSKLPHIYSLPKIHKDGIPLKKIWIWAQKKIIHDSCNPSQVRTLSL